MNYLIKTQRYFMRSFSKIFDLVKIISILNQMKLNTLNNEIVNKSKLKFFYVKYACCSFTHTIYDLTCNHNYNQARKNFLKKINIKEKLIKLRKILNRFMFGKKYKKYILIKFRYQKMT